MLILRCAVVVLGTGLTECVLSGVFSVKGKKVVSLMMINMIDQLDNK